MPNAYRKKPIRAAGAALLAAAVCCAGCQTTQSTPAQPPLGQVRDRPITKIWEQQPPPPEYIDATAVAEHDDIVGISSYFQQAPWLYDADGRVVGMRTRSYFVSSQTERGVFVRGNIVLTLNMIARDAAGEVVRIPVDERVLSREEAVLMRVRRKSLLGYSYGLLIPFPQSTELGGRQIELAISYASLDGRVVQAPPRRFRVPLPNDLPLTGTPTARQP